MTPQEILKALRDIHLPDPPAAAGAVDLAWEPFAVLGAVALLLLAAAWRRRRGWRREALRELRAGGRARPAAAQWPLMLDLLRRIPAPRGAQPPPECVFLPPGRVGEKEISALRKHIRRMVGR